MKSSCHYQFIHHKVCLTFLAMHVLDWCWDANYMYNRLFIFRVKKCHFARPMQFQTLSYSIMECILPGKAKLSGDSLVDPEWFGCGARYIPGCEICCSACINFVWPVCTSFICLSHLSLCYCCPRFAVFMLCDCDGTANVKECSIVLLLASC